MIPIVSSFLAFDFVNLANDRMQGGMLIVLVWLRLGSGKQNGRARQNDGRRLLHLVMLVGISPRMILVVRSGWVRVLSW
jgi:hypothetical protein